MSNKTVSFDTYTSKTNAKIANLLEKLRRKVKNFTVVDKQGKLVGEVRDLVVDANRQLNIIVSKLVEKERKLLFRLKSNVVDKIDPVTKSVSINIEQSQIEYIQKYDVNVQKESTGSKMAQNSADEQHSTYNTTSDTVVKQNINQIESVIREDGENLQADIIRLLGERLVVERSKRKVGEVIVRKEIETRMVQIPVRREKLIIEQVGSERKQIAEIDLGQQEISALESKEKIPVTDLDDSLTVSGEFDSPKIASLLLNAIALERQHGTLKVRVTVVVENEERQKTYQEWFNRTSKG